jgi:[protein-PII] uridylyltransferase
LMFLLNYKRTPRTEQVIEYMLYMLWDLGLKVGHATRSIDEAVKLSKEDLTIRTSLLEARFLWGDEPLYQRFKIFFSADVEASSSPAFVEAKLGERDATFWNPTSKKVRVACAIYKPCSGSPNIFMGLMRFRSWLKKAC